MATIDPSVAIGGGFTEVAQTSTAPASDWYHSPAIAELESRKVFGREWIVVGHQNDFAEPGAYQVVEVAGASVIVLRSGKERHDFRAFYNVCQHRGHQLLLDAQGTVRNRLVCPYHAWSYDLEGQLRGAPKMREVPHFCASDVQLSAVQLEIAAGFVFINLDPTAPSLAEMAPQFASAIRSMVAEYNDLRLLSSRSYDIGANWKIVVENFLEAYHVEFSGPAHRALGTIIDTDTYQSRIDGRTIEYTARGGDADHLPYEAVAVDDFTNTAGARFHQVVLYPHMTFSVFPDSNLLFVMEMRPNGVDRCAERISYYALDAEHAHPSESAEHYVSELLNQEDIGLIESVHRGTRSPGYRPGRLMTDLDANASWSEHFVHHFASLHLARLSED